MTKFELHDYRRLNIKFHTNFYSVTKADIDQLEEYRQLWNKVKGDSWYKIETFIKDFNVKN